MYCSNQNCFAGKVRTFLPAGKGKIAQFVDVTCPDCGGEWYRPDADYIEIMMPDYTVERESVTPVYGPDDLPF